MSEDIQKKSIYQHPFVSVENESHCDFVKLREMLIRTNMEDLRETTHYKHYELYRRCKLQEMGFSDDESMRSAAQSQTFLIQGTHVTGKTGKMAKKIPCQGKHREFCLNTGKTQGILLAQVVNVLILKVKDIAIVATQKKFSRSWTGLPTQFCVCNTHKLCKLAQGKFAVRQGKHREFENTI